MLEETTEEFHQSVCKNVNTNLSQVRQDVEVLKEWLKRQPHLPQCSSDTMLTAYLIACKNRMERAKEKIDKYYTVRGQMKDFFANRDPIDEKLKECAQEMWLFTLPKMTPDGCRIWMGSFKTGDPAKYNLTTFSKRILGVEDIKMNKEAFNNGCYFVFDAKHYSMAHVIKLTPTLVRQLIYCVQDVLPIIIKGIIFINAPSILDLVLTIIKPFLKSKLFQKIKVHSEGPEALENYFPKAMLPKDYGGDEDTRENLNEAWMKCLEENREWFLHEGSLTVDERKRITNKSSSEGKDCEEIHGSFKTLSID